MTLRNRQWYTLDLILLSIRYSIVSHKNDRITPQFPYSIFTFNFKGMGVTSYIEFLSIRICSTFSPSFELFTPTVLLYLLCVGDWAGLTWLHPLLSWQRRWSAREQWKKNRIQDMPLIHACIMILRLGRKAFSSLKWNFTTRFESLQFLLWVEFLEKDVQNPHIILCSVQYICRPGYETQETTSQKSLFCHWHQL